ncbi:hypothetical protein ACF0H5_004832 [Mactra antiquata]
MENFTMTTITELNYTEPTPARIICAPPPGWTGIPPPGIYANIADILHRVVLPIIIISGTFGNLVTVIILLRHSRVLSTTGMFLMSLAVSDTVLLYTAPLRRWIISVWEIDIRHNGRVACKTSVYLTYCSIQFSSWVLVAVTIERVISVVWPHRVKLNFTKKNTMLFISTLFVAIFGLNSHILYGFGHSKLREHRGKGFCEPQYEGYLQFWTKMYSFIDFVVAFALPFVVLVISNAIIIQKLKQAHQKRKSMSSMAKPSGPSDGDQSHNVTILLISLGVIFFICMAPVSVFFIYFPYWNELNEKWTCINAYEYFRQNEIQQLVFAVVIVLGYTNASINFFLYVASGTKFRSQIKALFLCRPVRPDSVFGSINTSQNRKRFTVYSEISSIEKASGASKMHDEVVMSTEGSTDHTTVTRSKTDLAEKY